MDARVLSTEMYLELSGGDETSAHGSSWTRAWLQVLGLLGYLLLGCATPPPPPAETPTVVPVASPAPATGEQEPLSSTQEQAPPAPRAASGGCPFAVPPRQAAPCTGSVPAAPVLDHQAPAPRAAPADLLQAIEQLRDERLRQRGKASRALLQTELRNLERLLKHTSKTDPDRPALLERVADTHGVLARAAARAGDAAAETKHRQSAVQHYQALAKSHPTHKRGDGVLHHLALELERLGDRAGARKAYFQLIRSYGKSKYNPHGYFAFAEMFFAEALGDPAKWAIAEQSYKQVLQFPPPTNPLHGVASYRMGQIYAHQQQPTKALESFVKALQHAGRFPQASETKVLRAAALDGAAAAYAEVGRPDRACPFFHRIAGTPPAPAATLRVLTTLGEATLRLGHRDEAVTIYRILERYHRGPEQCRDQTVLRMLGAK